jgi:hypothetical protein
MKAFPGSGVAPGGDPVRDVVGIALRVVVGMAILGLIVAFVIGVATAGLVIVGVVVAVGVVVQLVRWVTGRVRASGAPRGVTSVRRENRVDPATGQVRPTTVIDID